MEREPGMKSGLQEIYDQHVIGNYKRYSVCLVRGEGSRVWDDEGNAYLDFFPGWGCGLVGHCPPRLVEAVQGQIARLIHVPNTWHTEPQGMLAKELASRTGWGGQSFFCNSGTEANEAAIKMARLHGGPGRFKILATLNSFHGRTYGALSATGQPKYHQGVEPMLPGFVHVRYGDLRAMEAAVDGETCAILVEPIQGEGGIHLPPPDYLKGLRNLADQHDLMLILDEVQSGMGRTGKWFAHQHWGIAPDCVTLAKGLGGGIAVGGLIAREEFACKLKPGTHAATFGGNPIACVAALATIQTIEEDGLLERAIHLGTRFRSRFESLKTRCGLIADIRVKGAMIGVELNRDGAEIVARCLEKKLLINCTHQTVLRLLPALNLSDADLDEGCDILESVLLECK
ncbi:MAG: aspartate aminotransferase family protein [Gemmataceae bacterium]|nr:aspartate aminotransferase family protein [Gemmataceae bacterium]